MIFEFVGYILLFFLFIVVPFTGWVLGIIGFFRSNSLSKKIKQLNNSIKLLDAKTLANNNNPSLIKTDSIVETNILNEQLLAPKLNIVTNDVEQLNLATKSKKSAPLTNIVEEEKLYEPSLIKKFFIWLRKDWLMKLGAFMVFLAATWFFGIAYLNFSNEFKLMLVLLLSVASFVFGLYQYPKNKDVGQVLIALGSITAVTTFSFGYYGFELLTPLTVMIASIIVIGITYYISIVKKSLPLAVLSTIGFYIVPFLAITTEPNYIFLGLYVMFINIFILITTIFNKWEILITIASLFTGFLLTSITISNIDVIKTLISPIFLIVIANIVVLYLFIIFYTSKKSNFSILTVVNAIIITAYTSIVIPAFFYDDIANLSLILTAIILLIAAVGLYLSNINRLYIYIQVCASLALITIATTGFLQNQSYLPVIIGLEFFIYMIGLFYIFKDKSVLIVFNFLQLLPALVIFMTSIVVPISIVWYFVYLMILVLHVSFNMYINSKGYSKSFLAIYAVLITALFTRLIWLSLETIFTTDSIIVPIIAMIIYTIMGVVISYVISFKDDYKDIRYYGYALLAFVIGRLFLIDIWNMTLESRIFVFVLIGILFISTPYLKKLKKN